MRALEKRLCEEIELIHEQEVKRARDEDRCEPDWSNTIEMLIRKGIKAYGHNTSSSRNS